MAQKDKELRAAQLRAAGVKKEVQRLRQVLEQQFDVAGVTELENDIRSKQAQISTYQESITQIKKVGENHQRALVEITGDDEFAIKLRQINDEIRRTKVSVRETQERHKELDKANQEQHRAIVDTEERARRLAQAIAAKGKPGVANNRRLSESQ